MSVVIDAERLTALCLALPEFGSLQVADGRVVWLRSYRCTAAELPAVLRQIKPGEEVSVVRFPDAYKVVFSRLLATTLAETG